VPRSEKRQPWGIPLLKVLKPTSPSGPETLPPRVDLNSTGAFARVPNQEDLASRRQRQVARIFGRLFALGSHYPPPISIRPAMTNGMIDCEMARRSMKGTRRGLRES